MCYSWGVTARAHVQGSFPDLKNGGTDCAQIWYSDWHRLVGWCASQLGPTLHVRTFRVPVPDFKNGWADCVEIWYTDRDRLVGCRASQMKAASRSSASAGLNLSLARLSPQRRLTGNNNYY